MVAHRMHLALAPFFTAFLFYETTQMLFGLALRMLANLW